MRIAAIDQGTTSTRVLVVEGAAARIAHAVRHDQHHPQPGWVEHDPHELLANVRSCIAAAGPVATLGLDNQGESCLAWDADSGECLATFFADGPLECCAMHGDLIVTGGVRGVYFLKLVD